MLTKQNTLQIKGVAILCMIIYHLFAFPERLPNYICIDWFGSSITKAFQICVPIYLFMAGYGLQCTYQNKHTKWYDILNRIKKTYKSFWWVALPFIILGIIVNYYHIDSLGGLEELILNIIGVKCSYNGEWWFFSLYIELLILFYFISKLNIKWEYYLGIMLFILILCRLLNKFLPLEHYGIIGRHLKMIIINVNIFMIGCFFSKYNLYNVIINKIDNYRMGIVVSLFSLITPILVRVYIPMIGITELFFVPIFIVGIVYMSRLRYISKYLEFVGKHSMNLWLIHSFFIYYFLNRITFFYNSPIIMFIIVTAFSLACSLVIEYSKKIMNNI